MKPEAALQRQITDWLTAEHYWWRRRNAGAMFIDGRKIGYGVAGDSDLEVITQTHMGQLRIVFIEVKSKSGKQSPAQKEFGKTVKALGAEYILAYDLDSVIAAFQQ